MAELATIARPYAEALFKAVGSAPDVIQQLPALAELAGADELRQFADHPKVGAAAVFDLVVQALSSKGIGLGAPLQNLLRTVLENGRLAALPEIAAQFKSLVNAKSGVSDVTIQSAFPLEGAALADVLTILEKRFGRKLNARVEIAPELIGGVRVIVGDEVLDTSVKARLDQMKVALTS